MRLNLPSSFITGLCILWIASFVAAGDEEDHLLIPPSATFTITTSYATYAETTDSVHITVIGEIGSSGPHVIGPFAERGASITRTITFDRFIGPLKHVQIQNLGSDGWLPSKISCVLDGYEYTFDVQEKWADTFSYSQYLANQNGYEPGSQRVRTAAGDIVTFPVINLKILNKIRINLLTGNRPGTVSAV
jgi:hypothetical protein